MRRCGAALVVVALALAGCGGGGGSSSGGGSSGGEGPVKIAIVEPFSGSFGFFGGWIANSARAGIQLYAPQGLLGQRIEVVTRDNQLNPQTTVQAARELSGDSSVKLMIGPSFTALYNAARDIYKQNETLNCQPAVLGKDAIAGYPTAFRTSPTAIPTLDALFAYVARNRGAKTVGLVYSNDDTGQELDKDIAAQAPRHGLRYLGAQFYTAGAQDQTAQIRPLLGADVLYISGNATDAAVSAANARQLGFKGILAGSNGLQSFSYLEGAGPAAAGTLLSANNLNLLSNIPERQWEPSYRRAVDGLLRVGGKLVGPKTGVVQIKGSTLVQDCIAMWAKAVQRAGSFDADKVAKAWETMSFTASDLPEAISVTFTPDNHELYRGADQMNIYEWRRSGRSWYLKLLQAGAQSEAAPTGG